MKIISWNVNSVRVRIEAIKELLEKEKPDIVCLQETKVTNSEFPNNIFEKVGFHSYFNGIASYNGVAILTKKKPVRIQTINFCDKEDARHISLELNDIEFISIYVPAGGDDPDPSTNEKFKHKLDFLNEMLKLLLEKRNKKIILCGDLNIAPYEDDVWSHKSLANVVSHTETERNSLKNILHECNLTDSIRFFLNPPMNIFTWWSYRSPNFETNNRGRRLDHIFASSVLSRNFKSARILRDFRKKERPSDHVPVTLELEVS
jgi:exodeoxyribonuclease-3